MEDVIKSALGIKTEGYTHQLNFYYPREGGIQAMIDSLSTDSGKIKLSFPVKSIKKENGKFIVSGGEHKEEFDKLISTIPLRELIPALPDVPEDISEAAENLAFNSVIVVLVGVKCRSLSDNFAVYFPQEYLPFHRVCFLEYLGENYKAGTNLGLIAEITANQGDGFWQKSDEEIAAEVVKGLEKENFIAAEDVSTIDVRRITYAYVIYDLDYSTKTQKLTRFVEDLGINLCGRFAENKYLNMDQCFERAKKLAELFNRSEL